VRPCVSREVVHGHFSVTQAAEATTGDILGAAKERKGNFEEFPIYLLLSLMPNYYPLQRHIAFGGSLLLWLAALLPAAGQTFSTTRADYSTTNALGVAVADVNADGVPDLIATSGDTPSYVSVRLGTGAGNFTTTFATYPVDAGPGTVVVQDVNADGRPDLITSNSGGNAVNVLLADPATPGSFLPRTAYASDGYPLNVAVADVNVDGRPDLISGNYFGGTVRVRLANASGAPGTFLPTFTDYNITGAASVAVADVNTDGQPDLITANLTANNLEVRLGIGSGSFAATPTVYATGAQPGRLTVVDVNADGRLDLVALGSYSGLSVRLADATAPPGAFLATYATYSTYGATGGLAVMDVNGDGRLDLLTAGGYNSNDAYVSVRLASGAAGSFSLHRSDYAVGLNPQALVVADVSRDGRPDLIATSFDNSNVSVRLGIPFTLSGSSTSPTCYGQVNGTATVMPSDETSAYLYNWDTTPTQTMATATNLAAGTYNVTVTDNAGAQLTRTFVLEQPASFLTGSQTNPSCAANGTATVVATGPGPFTYRWDTTPVQTTATAVGLPAGTYTATVSHGSCTETRSFILTNAPDTTPPVAVAQNKTLVLNANGKATLLAAAVNNGSTDNCGIASLSVSPSAFTCANVGPNTVTLTVRDAAGNQHTATAIVTVIDNTAPTLYCQPITRQLDATGQVSIRPDELVAPPVIGLAPGTGTLGTAVANDLVVGDLDGDGDQDMVYANNGQSSVFLNNGAGIFTAHPTTPLLGGPSDQHRGVALGDVDGDGDLDLVFAVFGGNETVYLNNGSGAFTLLHSFAGLSDTYDVALADIDSDGDLDAAVINIGSIELWKNSGSGVFTLSSTLPTLTGHQWQVQFARLNADAYPDMLISAEDGRAESVFLNNGAGTFAAHPTRSTFAGGSFNFTDALGDLDGDGDLDVVYPNGASVVVWYNDNTGGFTSGPTIATAQLSNDLVLLDIDNDNDLDIVMGNGPLQVVLNNGNGTFTAQPSTFSAGSGPLQVLATADFDGDGLPDVVAGRAVANSGLNFFRNNTMRTADLCSGLTLKASQLTFDCSNQGPNNVTLTATDASGNISTCQAVVTIQDVLKPAARLHSQPRKSITAAPITVALALGL
jgi:hypothetical protein